MTNESQPQTADPIITYAEAGRQVGKHRDTIRRWADRGLIEKTTHPSGKPGIRQSELDSHYPPALRFLRTPPRKRLW